MSVKVFSVFLQTLNNVEYLHLITEEYLAKNSAGKIASLEEWKETGKSYGFGPGIVNNAKWARESFLGPVYTVAGYLGATQFPHVHVRLPMNREK
ncbi:MAG: hypothetical protein ABIQ31_24865 [Ferruginibacter sp.]